MTSSTNKKVQVQRFDREVLVGFVNPATFLTSSGIEILSQGGMVSVLPLAEVKSVSFVREFDQPALTGDRRSFMSRPKLDGLWLRLTFRDGDLLEGVVPNNLLLLEPLGFNLIPPDTTQRIFVPRAALLGVQVLGVVGSPLRMPAKKKTPVKDQIGLFDQGG